jgi:steroid 5-alpha reductase family enzyme
MPNGHGGYPWMGGPALLLVAFLVVLFLPIDPASSHGQARELVGLVLAALFGCRMAYHLHMRTADAYGGGGGYTDPAAFRRARLRYRVLCVVYAAVAIVLGHLALEAIP